jgi:catechol 2,3-dioxygenase-like lactoylglutathione lyase family enzyme
MITNISLVSVFVRDIDESLAFHTDILGFEAKDDLRLGPDFRWCTVIHPSQPELQVHLTTPSKQLSDDLIAAFQRAQAAGGLPGLGLAVDDCRATYELLKAKGVEFLQAPEERPYGVDALMRDNSGNWMVLVEAREYSPEDFNDFGELSSASAD